MSGEKMQVISCAFHGPIGALVWIPHQPGMSPGFAFGCADGSIHVYQWAQSSVRTIQLLIPQQKQLINCNYFQSHYQYFAQELVHDGPVMDIKFDTNFGRLASVGNGFPQVSELLSTNGSE
jgi:hypothetical protein